MKELEVSTLSGRLLEVRIYYEGNLDLAQIISRTAEEPSKVVLMDEPVLDPTKPYLLLSWSLKRFSDAGKILEDLLAEEENEAEDETEDEEEETPVCIPVADTDTDADDDYF